MHFWCGFDSESADVSFEVRACVSQEMIVECVCVCDTGFPNVPSCAPGNVCRRLVQFISDDKQ